MKKKLIMLLSVSLLFTAGAIAETTKQDSVSIDGDELAMSHINYIQYSLNKIRYSRSKATINAELDAVLNTINPVSLKYDALIEAYQELTQSTLMGMKLNIEQEEALKAEIQKKRDNAIFDAIGNLATPATIAASIANPASIGMLALEVGFNYAKTQGEITNDSLKQANKLDVDAIRIIDVERTGIFLSAAKVFKDKDYKNTHFINETMMQSLSQITYELDSVAKLDSVALKLSADTNLKDIHMTATKAITYLSEKDVYGLFECFLPYYLTLLKAHYYLTEIDSSHYNVMDSIFNKIVTVSDTIYCKFYQKNDFLKDAARYMILAEMQRHKEFSSSDSSKMNKYISAMDTNIQATLENKINHKLFMVSVYAYLGKKEKKQECLHFIHDVGAEDETGTMWMRRMSEECKDSSSKKCKEIKNDLTEWKKSKEMEGIYKRIKVFNDGNTFLHLKSPISLANVKASCLNASNEKDKKCSDKLKRMKTHKTDRFYVYYFPDFSRDENGFSLSFNFDLTIEKENEKWVTTITMKQNSSKSFDYNMLPIATSPLK